MNFAPLCTLHDKWDEGQFPANYAIALANCSGTVKVNL
jgi:hypothetical protein